MDYLLSLSSLLITVTGLVSSLSAGCMIRLKSPGAGVCSYILSLNVESEWPLSLHLSTPPNRLPTPSFAISDLMTEVKHTPAVRPRDIGRFSTY